MAEDFGDKTEAPTAKRREQAREEGSVARSGDLTAAALLIGSLVMLKWYGQALVTAMAAIVREMLGEASLAGVDSRHVADGILGALAIVGRAMLPLGVGII